MISLNKFMLEVKNKLKGLEEKKLVQERIDFGATWTAPLDGIIVRGGRAQANTSYMFCNDKTDNAFVGMCTIEYNQHYGTMMCPVIKGHIYEFKQQYWQEQDNLYIYNMYNQ